MTAQLPIPARVPLLDLDLLRTVVAIAETGSFSTAAEVLHRTPSAISMKVKKIEEIIGRRVFCRDSREVSLTPDGAFLLEHARRMLALNRAAVAHFIEPDVRGVVRLGASEAERFLPGLLTRFSASHPGVTVNVSIENSLAMREQCLTGALDLAIITTGPGDAGGETLYTEPLVWAARAGGIAATLDPLPVSVWEQDCAWRRAALAALEAQGRDWRLALESASNAAQRAAVQADLAVAPLPASMLGGDIVAAPAQFGLPRLPSYALTLVVRDDPAPAVAAMADHIRASFEPMMVAE